MNIKTRKLKVFTETKPKGRMFIPSKEGWELITIWLDSKQKAISYRSLINDFINSSVKTPTLNQIKTFRESIDLFVKEFKL